MSAHEVEPQRDDSDNLGRLAVLYEENGRVAAAFWEWQHKTLTLFTASVGALLAIEAWVYERDFGRYLAVPLVAAALVSAMCALFATRNREILNASYDIGAKLEERIAGGLKVDQNELIYTWLKNSHAIYRRYLRWIFWVAAILFTVAAVAAVIHPPHKAHVVSRTGSALARGQARSLQRNDSSNRLSVYA